ncbi:MAG: Type 1 glutamine amidotransferase-like domain-containing protein [Patescibacteria group bacterium]|nr:Type 1 glutamine amidotransferase-like domain-containing protein [Patescibacteria group bacterium]
MQNKIFLIGGGEIKKGETKSVDIAIKKFALQKDRANFIFFPTAAKDSIDYINSMRKIFENDFNFRAVVELEGKEAAEVAIMESSVIYFGGGKTEYLLSLFDRWQLLPVLKRAIKKGIVIVGISAGVQALAAWYTDIEDNRAIWKKGWGIIDLGCLVHSQEKTAEVAFNAFKNLRLESKTQFVAIGEKGSWVELSESGKLYGFGDMWVSKEGRIQKYRN